MEETVRVLPQNIDAEMSVLGAMMDDKTVIAEAGEELSPEDFYKEAHKIIFSAIMELFMKDIPVDEITLIENLRSAGKLEAVGGISYIASLTSMLATTMNVDSYIKIVKDKAILRRLIRSANEIIEDFNLLNLTCVT